MEIGGAKATQRQKGGAAKASAMPRIRRGQDGHHAFAGKSLPERDCIIERA
jgi:hypothetical protein